MEELELLLLSQGLHMLSDIIMILFLVLVIPICADELAQLVSCKKVAGE